MKKHNVHGLAVGRAGAILVLAILLGVISACDLGGSGGGESSGTGKKESEKDYSVTIMTWNLQALFDGTENGNEYDEYREAAGWSREKYQARLNVIAGAIGGIEPAPPDIIAIQELESAQVLQDLAGSLSKYGYTWSHFANNPGMSLGLGILSRFPLEGAKIHTVCIDGDTAPRPVLEVRITAGPQAGPGAGPRALALFVCHWKSKLGGEDVTEATRRASARIILRRLRELAEQEPELPVIIMGDLNENYDEFYRRNGAGVCALLPDDPQSADIAGGEQQDFFILSKNKPPAARCFPAEAVALYSPWSQELTDGSYYYKNEWETIDHFLLSAQLFNGTGWEFENSAVAGFQPFTNSGGHPAVYNPKTGSGLSDHLPLLLFLKYQGP